MIISHARRFIFFHNPKTAGMSLRSVIEPYHDDPAPLKGVLWLPPFAYALDVAHLRLREIATLFPAVIAAACTYRSLIFVRNPYHRFVSAMDQHFKTAHPDVPLQAMRPDQQMATAETFVDKLLRLNLVQTDYRFVHFSPQVWFLQCSGLCLPTDIVPMDTKGAFINHGLQSLGLQLQPVPRDNRSRIDLMHGTLIT